ncbi:hypothetical protein MASR2M15_11120 [Anaerolineales bacterium]
MDKRNYHSKSLAEVLAFEETDLKMNREGSMSPAQLQQLKKSRRQTVWMAGAAAMVFSLLASVFLFAAVQNGSGILNIVGIALTIINAAILGMLGRRFMLHDRDIRQGSVSCLEGRLERIVRPKQGAHYVLRIAENDIVVNKEIFKAFGHDIDYRLYFAPHTGRLLAAELTA